MGLGDQHVGNVFLGVIMLVGTPQCMKLKQTNMNMYLCKKILDSIFRFSYFLCYCKGTPYYPNYHFFITQHITFFAHVDYFVHVLRSTSTHMCYIPKRS